MKSALLLTILLGAAAEASAQSPATVPDTAACRSEATSFDARSVICPIPAGSSRRYHFQVNFSGGHDDTMASMQLQLDGAPLTCEAGSKVRLMGEDGEVSLICIFSTPQGKAEKHTVEASVSFSHAQYVSYAFGPR